VRIAAFTKYGRLAASTRQRILQYEPHLEKAGFQLSWFPLLPDDYVRSLSTGETFPKSRILAGYFSRVLQLRRSSADVLWIHSELLPFFPGSVEKLLIRNGTPIVYDLDDAVFLPNTEEPRAFVMRLLARKLEPMLRSAAACSCGNPNLRDYASQFCRNSIVVPTVVDADVYVPRDGPSEKGPPVIGWIGSPSTWRTVRPILPLLQQFVQGGAARFRAVGAGTEAEADRFPGLELVEWSEATEVTEVQGFDIGIMPLRDVPFDRGKSGFKLIQYMACGVPVIASPVGVNCDIVTEGENGLLAADADQWMTTLNRLVADASLRRKLGVNGRGRAVADYSLQAQAPRIVELFRQATALSSS
jgi:glycosyltransferase involved in cell wall biosynthesis